MPVATNYLYCNAVRWEVLLRWGNDYGTILFLSRCPVLFLQSFFQLSCVPVQRAVACHAGIIIWACSESCLSAKAFPFLCCVFLGLIRRAPDCFKFQIGAAVTQCLVWQLKEGNGIVFSRVIVPGLLNTLSNQVKAPELLSVLLSFSSSCGAKLWLCPYSLVDQSQCNFSGVLTFEVWVVTISCQLPQWLSISCF